MWPRGQQAAQAARSPAAFSHLRRARRRPSAAGRGADGAALAGQLGGRLALRACGRGAHDATDAVRGSGGPAPDAWALGLAGRQGQRRGRPPVALAALAEPRPSARGALPRRPSRPRRAPPRALLMLRWAHPRRRRRRRRPQAPKVLWPHPRLHNPLRAHRAAADRGAAQPRPRRGRGLRGGPPMHVRPRARAHRVPIQQGLPRRAEALAGVGARGRRHVGAGARPRPAGGGARRVLRARRQLASAIWPAGLLGGRAQARPLLALCRSRQTAPRPMPRRHLAPLSYCLYPPPPRPPLRAWST
jgi:hypothetical protein